MYYIITDAKKSQEESSLLQHFFEYLPAKPYCTDMLGALNIRSKAHAVTKAYIQPNPITRLYWMVYDLDNQRKPHYWFDEEPRVPVPNISVANRENGHEHVYYLVKPPVYTLRQARQNPLELAADVDCGLTIALDADPAYGKLIAKNPFYGQWFSIVWHEQPWDLMKLRTWLPDELFRRKGKRKAKEAVGLGRNCTVFEDTREYAYREWRRLKFKDSERLFEAVHLRAREVNTDFSIPLLDREILGIVRSITKWTSRHLTAEGFSRWCKQRGKIGNIKSQAVRKNKSAERAEKIKAFKAEHPDMSNRMIAEVFEVSHFTINEALKNNKV